MAEASKGRVACPNCGKAYRWKPDLAGRKVACKCGQKMRLPASATGKVEAIGPPPNLNEASTYDLEFNDESHAGTASVAGAAAAHGVDADAPAPGPAATGKCPACNQALKPGAVLCIKCGYNLQTGSQLQTAVVDPPEPDASDDDTPADAPAKPASPVVRPDLAAMGGGTSAVTRALEERADEAQDNPALKLYLPLALIVIGLAVRFVQRMYFSGDAVNGFVDASLWTGLEVVVTLPLLLMGLYLAVWGLGVSFGSLGAALFKLLAIILGPSAIGTITAVIIGEMSGIPLLGGFVGFMLMLILIWFLVAQLFDLDGNDSFKVLLIIIGVRFAASIIIEVFVVFLVTLFFH